MTWQDREELRWALRLDTPLTRTMYRLSDEQIADFQRFKAQGLMEQDASGTWRVSDAGRAALAQPS